MKRRSLIWWITAVLATGAAFIAYLALRFENMRLTTEVEDARKENRLLAETQRLYALEAQTLRERSRVRAIAERSLGMAAPELGRVVDMSGKHARGAGGSR